MAFIPRKWRLARWQVLLGAAATVAWWVYLWVDYKNKRGQAAQFYVNWENTKQAGEQLALDYDILYKDFYAAALLVIPAWFIFWLFIIAIRWVNHPKAARALTEVAAFAAMIGVAMLVTYLFPERHFWHGQVSNEFNYSPVVFAATLISEGALYIAWKVLNALKPAVIRPVYHAIEATEPADAAPDRKA
jgi:hypothetical protein